MTHKFIKTGQSKPYADSVYIVEIETNPETTDAEVWAYAQTIHKAANRNDRLSHDGSCGFPYGLDSYGSLKQVSSTQWRYSVTEPYCD